MTRWSCPREGMLVSVGRAPTDWRLVLARWMATPRLRRSQLASGHSPAEMALVGWSPTLAPSMSKSVVGGLFSIFLPSSPLWPDAGQGLYTIIQGLIARRFGVAADSRGMGRHLWLSSWDGTCGTASWYGSDLTCGFSCDVFWAQNTPYQIILY